MRSITRIPRRAFLRALAAGAGAAAVGPFWLWSAREAWAAGSWDTSGWNSPGPLVRYPQKTALILLTDRPPQLETPHPVLRLPAHPGGGVLRAVGPRGDHPDVL